METAAKERIFRGLRTEASKRNFYVGSNGPTSVTKNSRELRAVELTAAVVRQNEAPAIGTDGVQGRLPR